MSSLCAALLVTALVVGFLSCRTRKRKEAATSSGAWTNMATMASRQGMGMGGTKSGTTSRGDGAGFDPTATFASSSYPTTRSFGHVSGAGIGYGGTGAGGMGMGLERNRGFTNRLRLDEQEEWEMEEKERAAAVAADSGAAGSDGAELESPVAGPSTKASDEDLKGKADDDEKDEKYAEPETPTTARSDGEGYGSMVHLARLDKGDGPGRAI